MNTSSTEENYLKALYSLSSNQEKGVATNSIAQYLNTKASSVTDMIKKLADKGYVDYKKYQGSKLTNEGNRIAIYIIRKHRLWEVFLVQELNFGWDEVHEIAEQLEHIQSPELINRLENFLGFPKHDPHGDPIPDKDGNIENDRKIVLLAEIPVGETVIITGVNDSSTNFLQYLEKIGLTLGIKLMIETIFEYDGSITLLKDDDSITVSSQVSNNIYVKKMKE